MADSYVVSKAVMKCSFGDRQANLQVYPERTVYLAGQPLGNISDHKPMYNIPPFGKCRSLANPTVAAATAAHHGKLTPMPCIPNTQFPWMGGKMDTLIKGQPALLKSCTCACLWAGTIRITDDGQHGEGTRWCEKSPGEKFNSGETRETVPYSQVIRQRADALAEQYVSKEVSKEQYAKESEASPIHIRVFWNALKEERRRRAEQFYSMYWCDNPERNRQQNDSDKRRWVRSCVNGIDLDHKIEIGVLPPPDTIYRYCIPDETGGSYFFEEAMPMPSPEQLGILPFEVHDGAIVEKKIRKFQVGKDKFHYLKSTAAAIPAPLNGDWKDKRENNWRNTTGGALQFYIPDGNKLFGKTN